MTGTNLCRKGHDKNVVGQSKEGSCALCIRNATRAWRAAHPDAALASRKRGDVQKRIKGTWRDAYLRRQYGISVRDKAAMFAAQLGQCGICDEPFSSVNTANVDHNHATNKIRGLLCNPCNRMILPVVEKYYGRLERAVAYLKGHAI